MYCKNCGKELSSDAKFCSECGTKVEVEMPKPKAVEPMFFTKELKEIEPEQQEKPKKVMHLDEFNWDLDGYPTTPRRTEDVDFNWASVLEEKARNSAPKAQPVKKEVAEESGKSLEEEIFEELTETTVEEPTRLIEKDQVQEENVDKFYRFDQKQADIQAVLDEEYERIQRGEAEDEAGSFVQEETVIPDFLVETPDEEQMSEETGFATEPEDDAEDDESTETLKLVGVVWAQTPAGVVPADEVKAVEGLEKNDAVTETAEPAEAESESEEVSPSKGGEEESERKLTFDDVFGDDEDDDEENEKGGCLKVIAIILCILVVLELAILGIQYFAPNSQAGKYIDKMYQQISTLVSDIQNDGEEPAAGEQDGEASELAQIISVQMENIENLVTEENINLVFEEDNDYGFDEIATTYAFQNSPWYDNEEGVSVSFGDEIVGTLIQYYSGLSDKVNKLEIGEIRTGGNGFYVLTNVTTVDEEQTEGEKETQAVYLEPDTSEKEMKIIDVKTI